MNQILFFKEEGLGKSMSNIVRFFAVSMMLFGIILCGKGGYAFASSKKEQSAEIVTTEQAAENKPVIEYNQNNTKLKIKVQGKSEIATITYKWNDGDEKSLLDVSEQTTVEREIDIPSGKNELNLKVIYKKGSNFVYEYKKSFELNTAKIEFYYTKGTTQMKVSIEDPKGIEYVTYKWNDQKETKEEPDGTDEQKMEISTEIPFGFNTLTVTSVNKFGEESRRVQEVRGAEKPFIDATWSDDRTLLTINVTCRDSIQNVFFKVNGKEYALDIKKFMNQGYTIDDLNNVTGLTLEQDENEKIIHLKYEFPTNDIQGDLDLEIKSEAEYAKEEIKGTIKRD